MFRNTNYIVKTTIFFFLVFTVHTVFATDYYCDPEKGNSKNNGSKEQPWGSLASVFADQKKFQPGDKIYLLSGNHGEVIISGENAKYIKIIGLQGEHPIIQSLAFGADAEQASRWEIHGVRIIGLPGKAFVNIGKNSSRIRIISCEISGKDNLGTAIAVQGNNCRIENNFIYNVEKAILVKSEKNQIRNNRIEYFSDHAIEISGNLNIFEYNLIRESVNSNTNTAVFISDQPLKGTILRGNTIINFIKNSRQNIGVLRGIFGENVNLNESIIENNLIVSNGESGIELKGIINKTKIVNNTVVNPYFGIEFGNAKKINTPLRIAIIGQGSSENLIIRNNLVNNFVLEKIKGLADHNLALPVNVHEYDRCFTNWALFDFSLTRTSPALNKGIVEYAPKTDISLNKRPLGNFINIGAFEYTKINDMNETLVIDAELTDRQIHSKGKSDWDGQTQIRIGGAGEKFDAAGVFPFKLPPIPGGKSIISADFKVNLAKIDNEPKGTVDLYGLPPKSNFWVTEDMYYQGVYGQDLKARPIQKAFIGQDTYEGEVHLKPQGKAGLKDYLNTVYENKKEEGTYIFLRLNPSAKDVADFHRWSISSANSEKESQKPKLELVVGYPELNKPGVKKSDPVKQLISVAPNPVKIGELSMYFLGFDTDDRIEFSLFTYRGKTVLSKQLKLSDLHGHILRTHDLSLSAGKYILQYKVGESVKKQTFFVW